MRRAHLAHVLRAAARITDDPRIVVIGSQSILGTYGEEELPEQAWMSVEVDLAFLDDVDAAKADQVDRALGELSQFHLQNAYYAQGVEVATAVLPIGWQDRVVPFSSLAAHPAAAVCLEPHDLVVSKLVAMREKDRAFAMALLEAQLVSQSSLLERAKLLSDDHAVSRRSVQRWLESAGKKLDGR